MDSFKQQRKYLLPLFLTLILTLYQLLRVIAFVNVYGGVEHDSGWSLGAARSLAERGEYTSMVSTLVNPGVPGDLNVDEEFDIQAADGRIWFRTSTSIGPASIVPQALMLKLFGFSFWALRSGSLMFYTFFLLLAAFTMYRLAGLWAVGLFHLCLFCYPRLSIFLSYEALGEMPSMGYQIGALLAFGAATQAQRHRRLYFFGAGLLAGLAVNAKALALLSMGGIFLWVGYLWLVKKELHFGELIGLGSGLALPPLIWEGAQLLILTSLTNFDLYVRHLQQRLAGFLDEGSGLRLRTYSGAEFAWRKFTLLREVAHPQMEVTLLIMAGVLMGGGFLVWLWRRQSYKQTLLASLWLGWLVNTAWFVGLAKTGWPRHFWFGLILAAMLLCVVPLALLRVKLKSMVGLAGLLILGLLGWGFGSQPHVWSLFLPDEIVPYWLEKRVDYIDGVGLPWILVPRAEQVEVVDYINHLPPEARVYYPYAHKGAEIPPLTGRINYPLERRSQLKTTPHPADILLIPSFIVSPWTHDAVMRQNLLNVVQQACPQPVLKNNTYMICRVEELRPLP